MVHAYSSLPVFGKIASRARAEVERAPSEHNNCVALQVFLWIGSFMPGLLNLHAWKWNICKESLDKWQVKHPISETTVEIEEENNFSNSPPINLLIFHQRILATLFHPFPNSENRIVKKKRKVDHHWKEDNLVSSEFLTKKKQPDGFFLLFCKYCLEYPKQTSKRSSVYGVIITLRKAFWRARASRSHEKSLTKNRKI